MKPSRNDSAVARYDVDAGALTDRSRVRLAEERLRLLIDSIRDYAIFMVNPDGTVASWNLGAESIKGYSADEIIGRSVSTFYLPEDVAAHKPERLLEEARRNGRVEDLGWRIRKDGSRIWADVVITAVFDDDGELDGYVEVTRDLSDQRAAEEQARRTEERLRLLITSVRDYAIFMLDPQGYILTWNDGAERICGYAAREIIGSHFSIFCRKEDVDAGLADLELRIASETGRFEEENWRVRKDGSTFWASVILTAVRDSEGRLVGFAKVMRDLTDRREADAERLRLAHANEAIRLRDEFLSIASHELKTPLTALRLQLQGIYRLAQQNPELKLRLERAMRSSGRLDALIELLLDVGRISTGRFTLSFDEVDLSTAVSETIERMRETAVHAGCELNVSVEPGIRAEVDALRIEQVVSNLLSNAVKYAASKPVFVRLRREGNEAVIEVEDRGPGVPPEKLTTIFDRFERAASDRHYGGLGLGLFVTREIVVGHHGSVAAGNVAGGGACFTVRLPLRQPARVAPST